MVTCAVTVVAGKCKCPTVILKDLFLFVSFRPKSETGILSAEYRDNFDVGAVTDVGATGLGGGCGWFGIFGCTHKAP